MCARRTASWEGVWGAGEGWGLGGGGLGRGGVGERGEGLAGEVGVGDSGVVGLAEQRHLQGSVIGCQGGDRRGP